ncbi:carbon-nitrogen hydrolase family protein [soil metagenome]
MSTEPWESLSVTVIQAAASLDPAENRAFVEALDITTDLAVLPEAFARDFGPVDDDLGRYAEPLDGPFARAVADHGPATLVAGMFEATDDLPFNTLVTSQGDHYRKIHLYDSFGYKESDRLKPGPTRPTVIEVAGVPTGLMTCYDLRFPEMARALVDAGAEVIVVPAAWVAGEGKVDAWRTLIRARAIENTVFIVAAAQPAPRYSGHSMIVGPLGEVLAELAESECGQAHATLERGRLESARSRNPSLENRRLGAQTG